MGQVERRQFLRLCGWAGATALAGLPLRTAAAFDPPADDFERTAAALITPEAQKAIDAGLGYLAQRQNDDGSFGGGYGKNVAVVALAGLAFLSSGSTPGRGPYGEHVNRCVKFLLDQQNEGGFICYEPAASHGPMYGHGFATLFLAEVYGMSPDTLLGEKLQKAVKKIVDSQNSEGGWRYQPKAVDADISVTICQVMALRAARNAGIRVPNDTIDRCIDYVKRSQNPDGGFMYMVQGGPSAFPRSAAGVVALYSAGIYEGDELTKGLGYLMEHVPSPDSFSRESHFFYGHYYASQAMWHAGNPYWEKWYPAIRDTLVARQVRGGAWTDAIAPEYATAMACLILQMPNNYLPILQR